MLLVKCEAIVDACLVRNWLVAHLHLTNDESFLEETSLGRLRRQSETVKLHCDNEVQDLAVRGTKTLPSARTMCGRCAWYLPTNPEV